MNDIYKPFNSISFIILLFFIVLTAGCRKKNDCVDPCQNQTAISADFEMGQVYNPNIDPESAPYKVFVVDSIFPKSCAIKFRANLEGAKYKWLLGSEVIEKREFSRIFNENPGYINVTLIVEKEPNTSCFPNDDGRDTVTKRFKLVEFCELASVGEYRGVIDNSKDSITWKLLFVDVVPATWPPKYLNFCGRMDMIITGPINYNMNPSIKDTIYSNFNEGFFVTNRSVYLGTKYTGGELIGIGDCFYRIPLNNSVEFSYRNNNVYHQFRGVKIN